MMWQGFLLGVSTGTVCVSYCAPVIVPYLLGEGAGIGRNAWLMLQFLAGRLAGYLLFGAAAWALGRLLINQSRPGNLFFGAVYTILALLMFLYGVIRYPRACAAETKNGRLRRLLSRRAALLPVLLGFLTGLNLCPPFLLAITGAAATGSLAGSLWFFLTFFLGTAIFFCPIPLLGLWQQRRALQIVGQLAAVIIGCYYLFIGVMMLAGGAAR